MPHILISGFPGCGKTTLGRIFAKEYYNSGSKSIKYYECVAKSMKDISSLVTTIRQLDGGIILLDEIHALDRDFAEQLYTIMTDYSYNGEQLTPFTMIGCTTEYGEMVEKFEPFVQRFPLHIHLDTYTVEHIKLILQNLKQKEFNDLNENVDLIYNEISENCRNTPRIAISLLRSVYYLGGDIYKTLSNYNIITKGFTTDDYKILECLSTAKTIGIQAICSYLGTGVKNYTQKEGFLFKQGLISRTPRGRTLTDKGKEVFNLLTLKIKA